MDGEVFGLEGSGAKVGVVLLPPPRLVVWKACGVRVGVRGGVA